jgi:hypothetical protein
MIISIGVFLVEVSLRLEIHTVGDGPQSMSLHRVGCQLVYLSREALIVEKRNLGETVLLEVVIEGGVS